MTLNPGDPPLDHVRNEKSYSWLPILEGLAENADWNRDLIEHSRDLLCVHDLQGRLLSVNPRPAQLLGYTVEELLRIPMRNLLPARFRDSFDEYLQALVRDGEASGMITVLTRSGEERVWEYHNSLRIQGVTVPLVRAVAHDVTEKCRVEKNLRDGFRKLAKLAADQKQMLHALELFRTLLDNSNDAIEVIDPQTMRFLDVNQTACGSLGYSRDEMLSFSVFDIDPRATREMAAKAWEHLRQAGFLMIETEHRRKDGTTFPVEVNLKRVELDKEYIVAITRDITERKGIAAELEASERRFRALFDRAPVGIALVDSHTGKFLHVNPKHCEIVGRTEQEMLQLCFQDITHPDDKSKSDKELAQMLDEKLPGYDLEKRYVRPDGRAVWANLSVVPMWEPGEQIRSHLSIVQDITERLKSEAALRESEERLRLAQEVAHIGSFERNFLSGEIRWTQQMEAMYGLPPGGAPRTIERFLELIHSHDRKHISDLIERSMQTGEGRGEWRVVWPNGTVRWIAGRWRVFKDANRKPVRLVGADYDITDRKRIEHELRLAKERLTEEKLYLEHEIDTAFGFEEIIGKSPALKAVMESASRVASSDATVLLLGETGTGKELIARAIHRLSPRAGNAFIKMNCAAIPAGLLESELFGAEKGAYTGSTSRKIGRLELADKGTMFLDEIGEIALSLQPKLLRVLQDQEFERLGGTRTIKVDFRLIAATNRDLGEQVRDNQFRRDLYYRLNVFPIHLPPLRERQEDIPLLVEHFVRKCAKRMSKSITSIPRKTMDMLAAWHWPGNIRELENFIERSVILTNGSVLTAPLSELEAPSTRGGRKNETLEAAERRHILEALRQSNGRISGEKGAAARLGLKRTTLQSKLKQMGINPRTPPAN
jgi:formate hydrogenlyase transcriptional activator